MSMKKCNVNKTTGLPNPSIATSDIHKILAMQAMECGQPAEYKVLPDAETRASAAKHQIFSQAADDLPAIAYVCEEHAGLFRAAANTEVIPL